jgi:anti-sigma regulatory factor (Ser/Thr protein kinase)
MGSGTQQRALDTGAARDLLADDEREVRGSERRRLHARLRAVVVPGLHALADSSRAAGELTALAAVQARRLRAELESPCVKPADVDQARWDAREEEREWVRGHLHDTALQILEFIAGDGFDTGLSADKIAQLAGGAAHDLSSWIDADGESGEPGAARLLPELERVAAQARVLDPGVRLVVSELAVQPTGERVTALAGAVREAVTNARKHAHASQVTVRVESAGGGRTAVTITDDGIGFDPALACGGGRGLGVSGSIVGRMRRVGGHASLQRAPGGGTCVTLLTQEPAS